MSGTRNTPDIHVVTDGEGIQKLYTETGVLSIFLNSNQIGVLAERVYRTTNCFIKQFGHRDDSEHAEWHKATWDYETLHSHLIKNDTGVFTQDDINCLMEDFKKAEVEHGLCQDGKTACILTEEDVKKIKQALPSQTSAANQQLWLTQTAWVGSKAFFHAFISTLVDKYAIPAYMTANQKLNPKDRLTPKLMMIDILKIKSMVSLCMFMFRITPNLESMVLNLILPFALSVLKSSLEKAGITIPKLDIINSIIASVGVTTYATQSPLTFFNSGVMTSSAALGELAAYAIIRKLPKLKDEDQPVKDDAQPKDQPVPTPKPFVPTPVDMRGRMRRRKRF